MRDDPSRVTVLRIHRHVAWFRIHGYGLWLKWGDGRDLYSTRRTARYVGRLRWKTLRPKATRG